MTDESAKVRSVKVSGGISHKQAVFLKLFNDLQWILKRLNCFRGKSEEV